MLLVSTLALNANPVNRIPTNLLGFDYRLERASALKFGFVFLLQIKLQINSQTPAFCPENGATALC
jgi:hypothetical protein